MLIMDRIGSERFNAGTFSNAAKWVAGIVAVVLVVVLVVFVAKAYYGEDVHQHCVVTDKDRTRNNDGSSDTRVYTENCGTFTVSDTLVKGKFNSADTFGQLRNGHTYTLTTIGWRFGLTSSFPNIIEAVEEK
jgi:hypothetical protein